MKRAEPKFDNVIIDYETLGQSTHNSPVLSIAVTPFTFDHDKKMTIEQLANDLPQLFVKFNVEHQVLLMKRTIGQSTADWWKKVPNEAARIKSLYPDVGLDESVLEGHERIDEFVSKHCVKSPMVWCRGLSFDMPYMDNIIRDYGIDGFKWFSKFWNQRDTRTFIGACLQDVKQTNCPLPVGTLDNFVHHDPVHDNCKEILQLQYAFWYANGQEPIPEKYDIVK